MRGRYARARRQARPVQLRRDTFHSGATRFLRGSRRGRRQSLAQALEDVTPAVLLEVDVHRPDVVEDLIGDLLLLVASWVGLDGEGDRLAVLDGHLREPESLPAANVRRAVDRDR